MPKLVKGTDVVEFTKFKFTNENKEKLGRGMVWLLELLYLAKIKRDDKGDWIDCNNLTLINVILMWFGPMREERLVYAIASIQIFGALVGFFIRYSLVHFVYN